MRLTNTQKPHQQSLRKGRFSSENQIYHITFTTKNRQPIFKEFNNARALIHILQEAQNQHFAQTLAFVVMPDHLHWLIQLEHKKTLSALVRQVKAKSSIKIGQPIWQSGFYDHALRKEENLQHIARYIVANPLRAGLVNKLGDYPHWDAIWL